MGFEETRMDMVADGGLELPLSHKEGIGAQGIEGLSPSDAAQRYGSSFYENVLESQPGRLGAYEKLSEGGGREGFARDYARYVLSPGEMRKEDPELYDFMRDRIFRGREYEAKDVSGFSSDGPSFGGGCNKLDIVAVDEVSFTGSVEDIQSKLDGAKEDLHSANKYHEACLERFESARKTGNNVQQYASDLRAAGQKVEDAQRDVKFYQKLLDAEKDKG